MTTIFRLADQLALKAKVNVLIIFCEKKNEIFNRTVLQEELENLKVADLEIELEECKR
jgi:hypothetical protein